MISYKSVIGLPVTYSKCGHKIGVIKDVLYSVKQKILIGIIVEEKGLFSSLKYIPIDDVESINAVEIRVSKLECILKVDDKNKLCDIVSNPYECRIDNNVYVENGTLAGYVHDIILDFDSAKIEFIIISNGIIEDLISGRIITSIDNILRFSQDKLFVSNEVFQGKRWVFCIIDLQKD